MEAIGTLLLFTSDSSSLSWTKWIHYTLTHLISLRSKFNVNTTSMPRSSKLLQVSPQKQCPHFSSSPYAQYLFQLIQLTTVVEDTISWNSSLFSFLLLPVIYFHLSTTFFLTTLLPHTPAFYDLYFMLDTKFHTHIKQEEKLHSCLF